MQAQRLVPVVAGTLVFVAWRACSSSGLRGMRARVARVNLMLKELSSSP